jgi:tetratricopeptide (TPR) repeat protein
MLRTYFCFALVALSIVFADAQNRLIDSLKTKWSKETNQATKAAVLEELCFQFFSSPRQDSLKKYGVILTEDAKVLSDKKLAALATFYESQSWFRSDSARLFELSAKSIKQSEEIACKECLAINHLGRAVKYRNLLLYDDALLSLTSALAIASNPSSKRMNELKAAIHIIFSVVLHYKGKYSAGLEHAMEGKRLADELQDRYIQQKVYNSMAAIYGELYSPDNNFGTDADRLRYKALAKYYMIKTYEGSLTVSNKRISGIAAYNLGLFFSEAKQLDSSAIYLNNAIRLGLEVNYHELLSNAYNVKGGDMAKIKPDSALIYLEKAIYYAHEANFASNEASAMISKASLLQELGRKKEALKVADEALKISMRADVPATQLNAYKLLADLYEQAGNKALSYKFFKNHIAIKDSLISAENFARIDDLKARYDSELKDGEIRSLSQTAAIQALEIRQRNGMVIGLVSFILLAGIGIYLLVRQRTIAQQQKQLNLENRFLRFQLNPHFMSNALVSIQRFLFDTNAQQAGDYLARFSRLMRQFLEYSRKESIPIEDEIEVLRNYMDIQKPSFANGFSYDIHVDDQLDISDDKIPPMFAQPFIENALEHGIKGMTDGKLYISFKKFGSFVELIIRDNGRGVTEQSKQSDHISLATTIIRERIELLNRNSKEKIDMKIGSAMDGNGTEVTILLPIYS